MLTEYNPPLFNDTPLQLLYKEWKKLQTDINDARIEFSYFSGRKFVVAGESLTYSALTEKIKCFAIFKTQLISGEIMTAGNLSSHLYELMNENRETPFKLMDEVGREYGQLRLVDEIYKSFIEIDKKVEQLDAESQTQLKTKSIFLRAVVSFLGFFEKLSGSSDFNNIKKNYTLMRNTTYISAIRMLHNTSQAICSRVDSNIARKEKEDREKLEVERTLNFIHDELIVSLEAMKDDQDNTEKKENFLALYREVLKQIQDLGIRFRDNSYFFELPLDGDKIKSIETKINSIKKSLTRKLASQEHFPMFLFGLGVDLDSLKKKAQRMFPETQKIILSKNFLDANAMNEIKANDVELYNKITQADEDQNWLEHLFGLQENYSDAELHRAVNALRRKAHSDKQRFSESTANQLFHLITEIKNCV